MMHFHWTQLTSWLHLHPHYAGFAAFLIAFLESVAIIGTIIPGTVTMTAIGILIGSGISPIWSTLGFAIAGAFLGDACSYFLGYKFKNQLHHIWPFSKYPKILALGQDFFLKYGGTSILIGRFVGPVRAITPVVVGMFGMNPKKYFPISAITAGIWAPCYMLPGILLGAASLELPPVMAAKLIIAVLLILLFIWAIGWVCHKLYDLTHTYFANLLDAKWSRWEMQKSKYWLCHLLRHAERPGKRGQILPASVALLCLIGFSIVALNVITQGILTHWNMPIYHLVRGLRTPMLHHFFAAVSILANTKIILTTGLLMGAYLLILRKYAAGFYWLLALSFTAFAGEWMRWVYHNPRPEGVAFIKLSSSFPSGHVLMSTIVFGLTAFFSAQYFTNKRYRKIIYWSAVGFIFLVALSRLYLCQHWLTDVAGGILLAAFSLMLAIIPYRRLHRHSIRPKSFLILFFALWLSLSGLLFYKGAYQTTLQKSTLHWTTTQYTSVNWWAHPENIKIKPYRVDRLSYPTQILNIQWAGNLETIKKTLYQYGWTDLHHRDYVTTLKAVAREEEKEFQKHFTLLAPLYDDQHPVFEMIKIIDSKQPPLLLRLWKANITLTPDNMPLYIGAINYDLEESHHLIFAANKKRAVLDPLSPIILQHTFSRNFWQYKLVPARTLLSHSPFKKRETSGYIILIRPIIWH